MKSTGRAVTARDVVVVASLAFFGVVACTALFAPREYSDRAFRLLEWLKPAVPPPDPPVRRRRQQEGR